MTTPDRETLATSGVRMRATTRQPVGDGTEPWHGRASGYNHHKCGCAACREWMKNTKAAQGLTAEERAAIRERRAS